uniref:Ig-like domain-containing protein n=1 Tax=Cyprinus carpio TaxID=7962 RepID=A0A8C1LQJ5_CYPCA
VIEVVDHLVLICCQAAVSDLLTDLGSNVIINCDLDENEVYWILQKISDPPTVILRTLYNIQHTQIPPHYYNNTFRNKYSVQFKHRLVINNVTADELGVYYCMNTETPPKLSNSTRLGTARAYGDEARQACQSLPEYKQAFDSQVTSAEATTESCSYIARLATQYSFPYLRELRLLSLDVTLVGFTGSSVVLPCSSAERDLKLQDINVFWRHNGSETIYDLISGKDLVAGQNSRYKNRAQTFPDEYLRGNFSIKLINLTHADAGEFVCLITHSSDSKQETIHTSVQIKNTGECCFFPPRQTRSLCRLAD